MKTEIRSQNAPQPIGPYSQAIAASGNLLFVSMQIPLKPDGKPAGDDIASQTRQVIENIQAILNAANCNLNNVVKTTVYLKNLDDFAKMNEIYNEYFTESRPARAAVEVSKIPKDALVGIEAVAVF